MREVHISRHTHIHVKLVQSEQGWWIISMQSPSCDLVPQSPQSCSLSPFEETGWRVPRISVLCLIIACECIIISKFKQKFFKEQYGGGYQHLPFLLQPHLGPHPLRREAEIWLPTGRVWPHVYSPCPARKPSPCCHERKAEARGNLKVLTCKHPAIPVWPRETQLYLKTAICTCSFTESKGKAGSYCILFS